MPKNDINNMLQPLMTNNMAENDPNGFIKLLEGNRLKTTDESTITINSTRRLRSCNMITLWRLACLAFALCNICYLLGRSNLGNITTMMQKSTSIGSIHEDFDTSCMNISSIDPDTGSDNIRRDTDASFINYFRRAYLADNPLDRPEKLVPFILSNKGKLLCHRSHKELMRNSSHTIINRARAIVETVYTGVNLLEEDALSSHKLGIGLPMLVNNGDRSGCNFTKQHDSISFPRLTWSVPATKYDTNSWCNAVPMTSYSTWQNYHNEHTSHSSWDFKFDKDSHQYPWADKVNKAVWRGTTTHDKVYWGQHLNETPRGKLVKMSMQHPELVDAGFVNIIQQYADQKEELANQTRLVDRMKFDDFMKFKAIIDIDGNDWSSRFPKLLCTNSVVIKIDPDYIEYFYDELQPMVHYVPASLENITKVVSYAVDEENDDEMKRIVASANLWCKRKMTEKAIALDMITQLQKYEAAFNEYISDIMYDESLTPLLTQNMTRDLVECY